LGKVEQNPAFKSVKAKQEPKKETKINKKIFIVD